MLQRKFFFISVNRPRRETRAVFYPRRVHFFCVMICRSLHTAFSVVINGAAFLQCYTVCCTFGPLKVYGQDTKSRTRCQLYRRGSYDNSAFPLFREAYWKNVMAAVFFWPGFPDSGKRGRGAGSGIPPAFKCRNMSYIPRIWLSESPAIF